jgi:hypothetical protein
MRVAGSDVYASMTICQLSSNAHLSSDRDRTIDKFRVDHAHACAYVCVYVYAYAL